MKILHIIPSVAVVRGGPSQAVLQMVKALRQQGQDVEIATTNDNGQHTLDVICGELIDYQGVPIRFFERFSPKLNAIREFAYSKHFTTWLKKNIKNYDLVHVHALFSYPSTIAMKIARDQNVPYILRPIGQLQKWSLAQSSLRKKLFLTVIERQNIMQAKVIHCTSEAEAQSVKALEPRSNTVVIPLGIEPQEAIPHASDKLREKFNISTDTPVLLFLSRLHPKKGLELLFNALSQINNQPFHLLIAGEGELAYQQKLQQIVQQLRLQEKVSFVGFVGGELKQVLLQGSDLFVLPSQSENFGIVVIEALAAGLPVLISKEVGIAKTIEQNNAGFTAELSTSSFKQKIEHLLNNSNTLKEYSSNATALVQNHYHWHNIVEALQTLYQKTLR